jgi:hypothetical protein
MKKSLISYENSLSLSSHSLQFLCDFHSSTLFSFTFCDSKAAAASSSLEQHIASIHKCFLHQSLKFTQTNFSFLVAAGSAQWIVPTNNGCDAIRKIMNCSQKMTIEVPFSLTRGNSRCTLQASFERTIIMRHCEHHAGQF